MDLRDRGLCHRPLIPHLVMRCASPHVHSQRLASRAVDRFLEGEVDGEPAKHVRCVRRRMRAQMHLQGQLVSDPNKLNDIPSKDDTKHMI